MMSRFLFKLLNKGLSQGINNNLHKSITAPCKRDKNGKLYIRYNGMMRFALGFFNVFGALVLGLALFFFIADIQVEGLIALAYGGISFLAFGILLGGKQFKLDNNYLYWGRRANKSIEFSKLRYLCREVPPVLYNQNLLVLSVEEGKTISFSYNAYYGAEDFGRQLEDKLGIKFQPGKKGLNFRALIIGLVWFSIFYLIAYLTSNS